MASDPHVSVKLAGAETSIEFPSEGLTTSVAVTAMGPRLYRLDTVPLFAESASFLDIVEADLQEDGKLTFRRVVQRSGWRVFDFILPRELIDSDKLSKVLAHADNLGAHWERVFGGVLFVCVPPEVAWDPTPELK